LLKNSLCNGEFISDLKHLKEKIAENITLHDKNFQNLLKVLSVRVL
jgi:hypothetical protein